MLGIVPDPCARRQGDLPSSTSYLLSLWQWSLSWCWLLSCWAVVHACTLRSALLEKVLATDLGLLQVLELDSRLGDFCTEVRSLAGKAVQVAVVDLGSLSIPNLFPDSVVVVWSTFLGCTANSSASRDRFAVLLFLEVKTS